MRRSRKFDEELAVRKRPTAPVDQAAEEHGLADEALRLQDLVGNASTSQAIARSALLRDAAGTEAAPAKEGEKEPPKGVVYTVTMADIGTFELLSWSWGTTNSGGSESGGGPGKANVRDLVATKAADQHTAKLMQYASTGQHIATVELRTTKGGDAFVIRLKDVNISSFQMGDGSGGDAPTETFGLAFAELEYEFSEEKKK
jgi:type VI secretion system secreted protein Hcp